MSGKDEKVEGPFDDWIFPELVNRIPRDVVQVEMWKYGLITTHHYYKCSVVVESLADLRNELDEHKLLADALQARMVKKQLVTMTAIVPVLKEQRKTQEELQRHCTALGIRYTTVNGATLIWLPQECEAAKACGPVHHRKDGSFTLTGVEGYENAVKLADWLSNVFDFRRFQSDRMVKS